MQSTLCNNKNTRMRLLQLRDYNVNLVTLHSQIYFLQLGDFTVYNTCFPWYNVYLHLATLCP